MPSPTATRSPAPDESQNSCSYYPPNESGCRAPRGCYDCLNAVLENGCMVDDRGQCIALTGNYDVTLDFRAVSASESANGSTFIPTLLQFPAVNTTYCEQNDPVVEANGLSVIGFSYGTDGCVVVDVCESLNWVDDVGGSDCSADGLSDPYTIARPYAMPTQDDDDGHQGLLVFWCAAVSILLTLVAILAIVVTIHHHRSKLKLADLQQSAPTVEEQTPKSTKSGFRLLSLFGWETMRADSIEKERREMQARMGGNGLPTISPSHFLQLASVQPSAPMMSPMSPSAPRLTES